MLGRAEDEGLAGGSDGLQQHHAGVQAALPEHWGATFCHEGALENYYKSYYKQRVEKLIANEGKQVA